jgi:hypothetical protein
MKTYKNLKFCNNSDLYMKFSSIFSVSYMSDSKWRKALGAIADAGLRLERATWKFIDSDRLCEWGIPHRSDLLPTRLSDGRFQLVEYKWIEWIHFPRRWRPVADVDYWIAQDLEGLTRVLESSGHFHFADDEQGLTLFGYRR